MSRTAYHQAYYQAHKEANRASARAYQRRRREREAVIRIVCEAVTEARNDKPPFGGLTGQEGLSYADDAVSRDGSLTDCSSRVNHPTTPNYSGLSGRGNYAQETLNPHRGSQPVDALRKRRGANGS